MKRNGFPVHSNAQGAQGLVTKNLSGFGYLSKYPEISKSQRFSFELMVPTFSRVIHFYETRVQFFHKTGLQFYGHKRGHACMDVYMNSKDHGFFRLT
jgi:hypothetical protein